MDRIPSASSATKIRCATKGLNATFEPVRRQSLPDARFLSIILQVVCENAVAHRLDSHMIITIDGPAGAGKSTIARLLSERLDFERLDTGAMYRSVAWACLTANVALEDKENIARVARGITIDFEGHQVIVNGSDATDRIRSSDVTGLASVVAAIPAVREKLVELQRHVASGKNMVCEGRDQGSIVFPDAERKFFVTASLESRARRRQAETAGRERHESFRDTMAQLRERDERDRSREISPLIQPEDAIEIDTSDLTIDEAVDLVHSYCRVSK